MWVAQALCNDRQIGAADGDAHEGQSDAGQQPASLASYLPHRRVQKTGVRDRDQQVWHVDHPQKRDPQGFVHRGRAKVSASPDDQTRDAEHCHAQHRKGVIARCSLLQGVAKGQEPIAHIFGGHVSQLGVERLHGLVHNALDRSLWPQPQKCIQQNRDQDQPPVAGDDLKPLAQRFDDTQGMSLLWTICVRSVQGAILACFRRRRNCKSGRVD